MTVIEQFITDLQTRERDLPTMIADLEQLPSDASLGPDIDAANNILLSPYVRTDEKVQAFRDWAGRNQPCLFGRLGSKTAEPQNKGLGMHICWITEADIAKGADHIAARIQHDRRAWKDAAEQGEASGFVIVLNSLYLARALPSRALLDVSLFVANLYLLEHAPIQADTIYTEAVPLRQEDGQLTLFKAGCNFFYGGAHRTRNHDRRVPGDLAISVNSPGHYANSLVRRGLSASLESATAFVRETAYRSVGNGGIGHPEAYSTSWHHGTPAECRVNSAKRPPHTAPERNPNRYAATYHTDVLVPTDVTTDAEITNGPSPHGEVWPHLILDYISVERFDPTHVNYGLFHGHPVDDADKYHNPWPSRRAYNTELFDY